MDGGAWWAAVHGVTKSWTQLSNFTFHFSLSCIGEGNGNPLQCSCLENPRDRGGWWAAVSGVAQSRTPLKRLSSSNIFLFASDYHHEKKNYLEGIKKSGISFPVLSSPSSEASNGKICMYFFLHVLLLLLLLLSCFSRVRLCATP